MVFNPKIAFSNDSTQKKTFRSSMNGTASLWTETDQVCLLLEPVYLKCPTLLNLLIPFTATGRTYIRRKNDHSGGKGRVYTFCFNFVSTHMSKRDHQRGSCCTSMRGLFVSSPVAACSVQSCSLKNSSSMLCAVFVQMAGNSVLDVSRCDTTWTKEEGQIYQVLPQIF